MKISQSAHSLALTDRRKMRVNFLDADSTNCWKILKTIWKKSKMRLPVMAGKKPVVDDMPYVLGLGMDVVLNLHDEYKAILDMFEKQQVTDPVKAFFGELLERPRHQRRIRLH